MNKVVSQRDFKNLDIKVSSIYESGCYFMSLLYCMQANTSIDAVLDYYETFVKNGWMDVDCFILKPEDILLYLNGKRYAVERSDTYKPVDFVIGRWYNPRTGFKHFVVMKDDTEVLWDPLGNSITVKEGAVESYRLISLRK